MEGTLDLYGTACPSPQAWGSLPVSAVRTQGLDLPSLDAAPSHCQPIEVHLSPQPPSSVCGLTVQAEVAVLLCMWTLPD